MPKAKPTPKAEEEKEEEEDARHARNAALLTASLGQAHAPAIDMDAIAAAIEGLDQPPPMRLEPSRNERMMHVDPVGETQRILLRNLGARAEKWPTVAGAIEDFVRGDLIGYGARQTTQIPGTHDTVTYPNLAIRGLLLLEENVGNGRPTSVTPEIKAFAAACDRPQNVQKRRAGVHTLGATPASLTRGATTTLPLDARAIDDRLKLLAAWRKCSEGHAEAVAEALQFERDNAGWASRLPPIWAKHCEAIKTGAAPPSRHGVIPRFVGDWADTRSRCVHPEGLPECSAEDLTPVPINPAPPVREMYDTVRAIIADSSDPLVMPLGLSLAAHMSLAFNRIDDAKALVAGTMPAEAPYGVQGTLIE